MVKGQAKRNRRTPRQVQKEKRKAPKVKAQSEVTKQGTVSGKTQDAGSQKVHSKVESEIESKEKALALEERNIGWIAERLLVGKVKIWTMDIETDPFKHGKVPVPFLVGLYDGITFRKFWSDKSSTCLEKAKLFLDGLPEHEIGMVYMHNGGRFDFFYMMDWFEGKTFIINSRIIRALMDKWEFRDSYAIMPFPLKAYKKDDIDISHLEAKVRKKYAVEIESYLEGDCIYLWELCMEFSREFGDYTTIASAAFKQLTDRHTIEWLPESQDEEIRKQFFYGGRVECFQKGIIEQECNIYDVNSMYPSVMQDFWHPTSWCVLQDKKIRWSQNPERQGMNTFFITVEGKNDGAFPMRMPNGGVDFTVPEGVFHVSIHEWLAAIELERFRPTRIHATYNFLECTKFRDFVQHFYNARKTAKESGDAIRTLFYKYILNSAYGKFAINPENFFNWQITKTNEPPKPAKGREWTLDSFREGVFYVWKQNSATYSWSFKNVATGSSITGAARSVLLRAIAKSDGVIYCDTDSLICEKFDGGELHETKLGAWKCEAKGDLAAIAGKKMYAIFDGSKSVSVNDYGPCIKQANKGVVVTAEDIVKMCKGENIFSVRDAPTFQRDGTAKFVTRKTRMT